MPKFTIKKKIVIVFGIILLLLSGLYVGRNVREQTYSQVDEPRKVIFQRENMRDESNNIRPEPESSAADTSKKEIAPSKNTETITVIAGEDKINLSFAPNTIFYDALVQARSEGKISFSGKNYPGLGFFVTDIQNLHAGDGEDLLYYVNGKEATVGVSGYVLKNGDVLEWKLE